MLPGSEHTWQHLESAFRRLCALYGYREIRTPTFEETALFTRSVGETTDIVTKEMYEFKDKGDRSMTLKPEGTAGAMRALIQHSLCPQGSTARLYYITPFFRYERPQKGRLREAHQVGVELVGVSAPSADAEVIDLTAAFYRELGMDVSISLNSIGREECRERFKSAVLNCVSGLLADQPEDFRVRANKNPLRLLDSKDESIQAALADLPPITDFLEDQGKEHFEALQAILSERSIKYSLDPRIVRGLDYYTDTVFEVVSDKLGAQNSLCGGGRYDNLIKDLGGPPTPSVGVGIGIERALLACEELGIKVEPPRPHFFAVAASPSARGPLERLAVELRGMGKAVIFDLEQKSLKSQLKQADRYRARYALIVGDDELRDGVVTVRDLDSSSQEQVSFEAVTRYPSNE